MEYTVSKNNRNMKRGICVVCGTIKTMFVKSLEGGSVLNKVINNLPFEMHLPSHNFTGPGTKLKKRLISDLTPKEWSKPINRVDFKRHTTTIFVIYETTILKLETKNAKKVC